MKISLPKLKNNKEKKIYKSLYQIKKKIETKKS